MLPLTSKRKHIDAIATPSINSYLQSGRTRPSVWRNWASLPSVDRYRETHNKFPRYYSQSTYDWLTPAEEHEHESIEDFSFLILLYFTPDSRGCCVHCKQPRFRHVTRNYADLDGDHDEDALDLVEVHDVCHGIAMVERSNAPTGDILTSEVAQVLCDINICSQR